MKSNFSKKIFRRNDIDPAIIKEAIFDYRTEGKRLMKKLGAKYGLDINNSNEYQELTSRSNNKIPRSGELSRRWNYSFHGGECGFSNKKHQQSVEVVLSNAPDFGCIDAWFLMSYMESTEKYKTEIKGVQWTDLKPIINELYKKGDVVFIER